jgi:hypothetical protein
MFKDKVGAFPDLALFSFERFEVELAFERRLINEAYIIYLLIINSPDFLFEGKIFLRA